MATGLPTAVSPLARASVQSDPSLTMTVMRSLADGRIRWGFFPPGSDADRTGLGIWLGAGEEAEAAEDDGEESADETPVLDARDDRGQAEEDEEGEGESQSEEAGSEEGSGVEADIGKPDSGGFFAALQLEDESSEENS